MIDRRWGSRAAVLAALAVATAAFGADHGTLERLVPSQGLQRTDLAGMGRAFVRPGASLASYDRVLLDPVDVSFRRDWVPYGAGSGSVLPMDAHSPAVVRGDVVRSVRDAVARALPQHGLASASEAGPGVLRLKLRVVDVYLSNPWGPGPARSRVLATSSGEMTLVAELSDAATGEVLARAGDWQDMRNTGRLLPSNDIRTGSDIDGVAQAWAASLVGALRPARGSAQ